MMTLEADSVNVQALDMGHIVVDIDGVNITELINKAAENGYSLRVVDDRDSTETPKQLMPALTSCCKTMQ